MILSGWQVFMNDQGNTGFLALGVRAGLDQACLVAPKSFNAVLALTFNPIADPWSNAQALCDSQAYACLRPVGLCESGISRPGTCQANTKCCTHASEPKLLLEQASQPLHD